MLSLLKAGLDGLLQLSAVRKISGSAIVKVAGILKSHFLNSSRELGQAWQESYNCAMAAIASGLVSPAQAETLWQRLAALAQQAAESRLSREFSQGLRRDYLQPFARQQGWNDAQTEQLGIEFYSVGYPK
jgi:hypothetical protein